MTRRVTTADSVFSIRLAWATIPPAFSSENHRVLNVSSEEELDMLSEGRCGDWLDFCGTLLSLRLNLFDYVTVVELVRPYQPGPPFPYDLTVPDNNDALLALPNNVKIHLWFVTFNIVGNISDDPLVLRRIPPGIYKKLTTMFDSSVSSARTLLHTFPATMDNRFVLSRFLKAMVGLAISSADAGFPKCGMQSSHASSSSNAPGPSASHANGVDSDSDDSDDCEVTDHLSSEDALKRKYDDAIKDGRVIDLCDDTEPPVQRVKAEKKTTQSNGCQTTQVQTTSTETQTDRCAHEELRLLLRLRRNLRDIKHVLDNSTLQNAPLLAAQLRGVLDRETD